MKSLSLLFFLPFLSLLVQVTGLELAAQPQTLATGATLVVWARQPTDPASFTFDLRFTCGPYDEGLALPNIEVGPSQTFGSVPVVFPFPGVYSLTAVTGPAHTVIGKSNVITAVAPLNPLPPAAQAPLIPATPVPTPVSVSPPATTQPPSSNSGPTSLPVPSSTPGLSSSSSATTPHPSSTSAPISSLRQRSVNLPAVVGGVIGGLVLLGLLIALFVILSRRKRDAVRRYTFHRDMMVQPRNDSDPALPQVTVLRNAPPSTPFGRDLESGSVPPPVPPKLSIAPGVASAFHRDHDRGLSPVTPRMKRNFLDATFTPASHERESELPAPSIPPVPSVPPPNPPSPPTTAGSIPSTPPSLPLPVFPKPFLLKSTNPFIDTYKEPEGIPTPPPPSPSTRLPSTVVIPSPRGPRPSLKRSGNQSTTEVTYPELPVSNYLR